MLRLCLGLVLLLACGERTEPAGAGADAGSPEDPNCPARAKVGETLPDTGAELSKLESWVGSGLFTQAQLDEVLLSADEIAAHDAALRRADESSLVVDLARPLDSETVRKELFQRLSLWEERFRNNEHTLERGDGLAAIKRVQALPFNEERSLYVALKPITLRCAPLLDVVRSVRGDKRFDRNLCSQVRAQEPLEVLGQLGELRFVRSAYAIGFIAKDAPLSPRVPDALTAGYRRPRERVLQQSLTLAGVNLAPGTVLVSAEDRAVHVATAQGFQLSQSLSEEQAQSSARALTRGEFLRAAFGFIGSPYGLGDENGGRDCSRLVLDVLRQFGLHLPRASVQQSQAGLYTIEVPPDTSETDRLGLLDEAAERGVVLMHFPGHIAFYLGRDQGGVPRLFHSFAEFLRSCPSGGETLVEV
ncbi:MAG TPA: NlpC/P60 family protein, partial [Polyangiales bacterium]